MEVCLGGREDVDARNHVVDGLRIDSVEDGALEVLEKDSHDSREGDEEDGDEHAAHTEETVDFALSLLITRGLAESLPFLRPRSRSTGLSKQSNSSISRLRLVELPLDIGRVELASGGNKNPSMLARTWLKGTVRKSSKRGCEKGELDLEDLEAMEV